jgi:serine/threonine-protein kinase
MQFIGMFLDEARLSAHLSHSNCVQVFDIGVGDNTYFIVMEYVDGADLKGVIEHQKRIGQRIPVEEACLICAVSARGSPTPTTPRDPKGNHLHIVHRDMSPPNVHITRHGEVKIVDFGSPGEQPAREERARIIKGKFSYLSRRLPWVAPWTPRTGHLRRRDHPLGVSSPGRRLFMGETDLETVRLVQSVTVPPIRQFNPRVTARDSKAGSSRALSTPGPDTTGTNSAPVWRGPQNNMLFHLAPPVCRLLNPPSWSRPVAGRGQARGRGRKKRRQGLASRCP